MTVVVLVCAVLLAAAAILAVSRIERGPSMLDRTIALDVLTTTLVAFVGLEAAWSRRTDTIPILVALALVGFVGSVTIARFASREPPGEGRVRTLEEIARDEAAQEARARELAAREGSAREEAARLEAARLEAARLGAAPARVDRDAGAPGGGMA